MTQQKFVKDAVTLLNINGFEVVIKFGKFILEEESGKVLWQFSITGWYVNLKKDTSISDFIQQHWASLVLKLIRKSSLEPCSLMMLFFLTVFCLLKLPWRIVFKVTTGQRLYVDIPPIWTTVGLSPIGRWIKIWRWSLEGLGHMIKIISMASNSLGSSRGWYWPALIDSLTA